MNLLLWVLQILLALHTLLGAIWKFANSEQSVRSLSAIPHVGWLAIIILELLCAAGLVAPLLSQRLAVLAPVAAACISAEMLFFSGLHLRSGSAEYGEMIYWLVVAAISGFIAYGRFVLKPPKQPL